jgi:hypothetical protein
MPSRIVPILVISFMLGASLVATAFQRELWPFSFYGMFARPPRPEDPYVRVVAVSERGERFDPFWAPGLLAPADRFLVLRSLTRTVLVEKDAARATAVLAWLRGLYLRNRERGAYAGAKVSRLEVEVHTPFSPDRVVSRPYSLEMP